MTNIPAYQTGYSNGAKFNAVKIKINEPTTTIPEGFKPAFEDNGTYNAVNLEVNNPKVEVREKKIYDYPEAKAPVTFAMAGIMPVELSEIEEVPVEEISEEKPLQENKNELPPPNITTLEDEKATLNTAPNFQGINFKAAAKNKVEIVPDVEIMPDVDIKKVVDNLNDENYDIQALQMEEIVKTFIKTPDKIDSYVNTDIFDGLIKIMKKDSSNLAKPTEEQNSIREKYIVNMLVKRHAVENGQDENKVELPYKLSDEEVKKAMTLSPLELAERNKEYAISVLSILAKSYSDGYEKQTGNIVPLTDMPGVSDLVDNLRHSSNPDIKIASMDALNYIKRPEYKEELKTVFSIMLSDTNRAVASRAAIAIQNLEKNK